VDELATPLLLAGSPGPAAELPVTAPLPPPPAVAPALAPAPTAGIAAGAGSSAKGIAISLQVRPWAYVEVDGGPRSQEALAEHRLQLPPGPHQVKITCQVCEPSEETITVPDAATEEPIRLAARPRPAFLVFEVDPPDATVRVGDEERAARDTAGAPFLVTIPRGSFQNPVEYSVRSPGYTPLTNRVVVKAGERLPVTARLSRP
jgi:serine/threonine-protein kinase